MTERLAVLSNFSDSSPRQGEQQATASVLAGSRFLKFVTSPGRLDAGDVLRLRFTLPAGSYATVLLEELLGPLEEGRARADANPAAGYTGRPEIGATRPPSSGGTP